ncbi:MAG: nickel pincer cofactor biosynthesis protein LarC [Oscillospiraceae bacterium]|nr:nickel pincer cofactor biosynthesis protein LarC [Oscillospiraceae bacterium]
MKTLYLECRMGASGDMLSGALLGLHPDPEAFISRLNTLLGGKAEASISKDKKCGITGTHFSVSINGSTENENMYDFPSGINRHHSSVSDIKEFISSMELPERVRDDALSVYALLAEAEGKVHGQTVENIHFHEIGTLDALADILSFCMLINELAPDQILASPVHAGSGTVKCAHGILPVPAPATEILLRDIPWYTGDIPFELCTPTGAALLKHFAVSFGPMPVMTVEKTGIGTGSRDLEAANILRAFLGDTSEQNERIIELKCNLDDMTGEELGFAMERLFEAGALDVYFTNISMKKCRPAVCLTCMCREEKRGELLESIFKHTTTLGVREYVCSRHSLRRSFEVAETPSGEVRIKTSSGYGSVHTKAEFEDLAEIARSRNISLFEAREMINKA